MNETKVFGIGFHKTATTSLAKALTILGYRVTGPNGGGDPEISQNVYDMAYRLVEEFDAFQDNPWPIIYKELDEKFPGSKFILTLRPPEQWIKSIVKHFDSQSTYMREWIYGVGYPKGNEELYVATYEKHNKEVTEYFKDRPDDLLVFRITEGDGWEELCPFLHKPIPGTPFPHENPSAARPKITGTLFKGYRKLRSLVGGLGKGVG